MVFSFGLLSRCGRRGPMNQFPLTGTVQGRLPSLPRQKDARLPEKSPWEGPRSRGPERGEPKEKALGGSDTEEAKGCLLAGSCYNDGETKKEVSGYEHVSPQTAFHSAGRADCFELTSKELMSFKC